MLNRDEKNIPGYARSSKLDAIPVEKFQGRRSGSFFSFVPYLAALILAASSVAATCGKASSEGSERDFSSQALNEAASVWKSTRNQLNSSYTYIRIQGSMTGENYVTLVRFEKGELTARVYKRLKTGVKDGKRHVEIREAWMAEKGMKRLSGGEGGFPGLTMEELYQACEKDVLNRDPKTNHVGLAADERGVLTKCYYSPKMCADDCGRNYGITYFYEESVSDEELKAYLKSDSMQLRP